MKASLGTCFNARALPHAIRQRDELARSPRLGAPSDPGLSPTPRFPANQFSPSRFSINTLNSIALALIEQ